ncbi:hypothetical protein T4B_10681 [Trichinella pseudospiralis]|uniref:Uncharacterized protein n=1 Tax=Trichinella pseudospiralis TaxID=6337 RepID=A0A0V1KGB6_TRIPS|nr:hypothetical protein T4A_1091 [Trichinella pseudospiralis]KRZ32902.1 hypothetical protein T4B_10681 [Trichinella pseudospiralis]KRZ46200.1 hypothetical protein T4C_11332 [Trichinella pseudospiralis]
MSVSVLAVIGVDVLRLLRNKRLTPPIMTRFDDVNKKELKGATNVRMNGKELLQTRGWSMAALVPRFQTLGPARSQIGQLVQTCLEMQNIRFHASAVQLCVRKSNNMSYQVKSEATVVAMFFLKKHTPDNPSTSGSDLTFIHSIKRISKINICIDNTG